MKASKAKNENGEKVSAAYGEKMKTAKNGENIAKAAA